MEELSISTHRKNEFIDITRRIQQAITRSEAKDGTCFIYCPHTTAGLTINENADPSVAYDILTALDSLAPQGRGWTHAEGNAPAHIKASLIGNSLQVAFEEGKLLLGTWQGIFFCEFDGPRRRRIWLRIAS